MPINYGSNDVSTSGLITANSGNFTQSLQLNGTGVISSSGGTTNYISKFTGGSTIGNSLVFDNGTNVGIGTSSPAATLEINGPLKFTNCDTRIMKLDNSSITISGVGNNLGHFGLYIDNRTTAAGRLYRLASHTDGTNGSFRIRDDSAGADRLIISSNGNVGIETATPSGKLDVNGTLYVGATGVANNLYIRTGQAGVSETALRLRTDTSSNLYLDASNAYVKVGNQSADVDIAAGNAGIRIGNNSAQTLANQNIRFVPANTEVMRITPTGVGIGTTTPSGALHVAGDVLATGSFIGGSGTALLPSFEFINDPDTGLFSPAVNTFGISTSGVERLRVDSVGNIGIGTVTPSGKLHVSGTIIASGGNSTNWNTAYGWGNHADAGYISNYIYNGITIFGGENSIQNIVFENDGSAVADITWDDPNDRLQINAVQLNINAENGLIVETESPIQFNPNGGGNVGIGTSSPSSKLQVSGLITANSGNFTNLLTVNGTGVWHSGNFDSSNIVRTIGTQTISGVKTFSDGLKVVGNGAGVPIELGVSQDAIVLFGKTSNGLGIGSNSFNFSDSSTNVIDSRELLIGLNANDPILTISRGLLFAGNSGVGVINYYDNGAAISANRLIFDVTPATTIASANTTLRTTTADGNNIVLNLPNTSGTLALLTNINTSQITGVLAVNKGGTNITSYSNGQLLIGSGTSLVANTLSAGTGIAITNGSGTITINTSGLQTFLTNPVTGTGTGASTSGYLPRWNSTSGLNNSDIYQSGSNIGIGIVNPTSKLHVAGDILATESFIGGSGTAALPSFEFVNDPDTGLFSPAANTFAISTSGVERLLVDNAGNVGIGNSYPNSKLDVRGTFACGTPGGDPYAGGQGLYLDPSVPSLTFNDISGPNTTLTINNDGLTLYDFVGSPFFYTDRNNAGIGIGTATPYSKLQVNGSLSIAADGQDVANGNEGIIFGTDGSISSNDSGPGPIFSVDAINGLRTYGNGGAGGAVILSTDRSNLRVGIGTDTPDSTLHVVGDVNIDGNLIFDSYTESVVSNGNSGASKTLSLASGTVHTCTLTNNCTFTMPTATAGKSFSMFLNSGSGNYTASFSGVRWADSAIPTATITASKVDIYSFISDGTYWYGSFSQNYG